MHGRRFGPEVYVRKAEDDIGRAQLRRSLEEPAWDGETRKFGPLAEQAHVQAL